MPGPSAKPRSNPAGATFQTANGYTMRCWAAVLLFAALAAPAAAQNAVIPTAGVTVTGSASQRFPVQTVQITAFGHGAVNEGDVIAAMRAAGLEGPSVSPAGLSFPNRGQFVLRGTINAVTPAKLDAIAVAAAAFVQAHPNVGIDNVQMQAPLEGCPALEDAIRVRAFAEARRRAEALARDAGVVLGDPKALIQGGGCPMNGAELGGVPVDPTTFTAAMTVSVTVTFALK
jgi:hypothetical protein